MQRGIVVLIDDNKSELRLFEEAFHNTQVQRELKTFSSAEEAFSFIVENHEQIFMIISDIKMPVMTGPELLKKINENHELKMQAIPFVFFSNSEDEKDVEQAYALAAQGFFQKPFDLDELTRLFKLIIDYWTAARIPRNKHRSMNLNR